MRDANQAFRKELGDAVLTFFKVIADNNWDSELAGHALLYAAAKLARVSGVSKVRFEGIAKNAYQRVADLELGRVKTEEERGFLAKLKEFFGG